MPLLDRLWHAPRALLIGCITVYQKIFSPDHSFWAKEKYPHGYCRYVPSCSAYARSSIEKYGVVRGVCKTIWRILRCNPWGSGGVDEP